MINGPTLVDRKCRSVQSEENVIGNIASIYQQQQPQSGLSRHVKNNLNILKKHNNV